MGLRKTYLGFGQQDTKELVQGVIGQGDAFLNHAAHDVKHVGRHLAALIATAIVNK